MSKCRLCNQEAGFLRTVHKECAAKHAQGTADITDLLVKAARGSVGLKETDLEVTRIAENAHISATELDGLFLSAYGRTIISILENDLLTHEEEDALGQYRVYFGLSGDMLKTDESHWALVKARAIRDVLEGDFSSQITAEGTLPFNFQKSENLIWLYPEANYFQPRTTTAYQGRSSGVSVRVVGGVYYRVGEFSGDPVVTTQMALLDTGVLAITSKHLYFAGGMKSLRIRYDEIISISPYSDAIAIQRDNASELDVLQTNDGWFTYNLVKNLASAWQAQT
jgi:hypothetical protein